MKLLGSTRSKTTKDKHGENVRNYLEITEVALVHYNIFNNDYQHDSRILSTFLPNKSFCQLLDISPKNFTYYKHLIQNFYISKYGLLIKILSG